jgi:choice-of-anchor A domain-containing protein
MYSSARSPSMQPHVWMLFFSLLAAGCSADSERALSQNPARFVFAIDHMTMANPDVRFFLTPGQSPSGDLDWQAHVSGFTEFDFQGIAPGNSVDALNAGPVTVELSLEGLNGTEPVVGTYQSPAFLVPGAVYENALVSRWHQFHSQMSFTFSEPVEGFGAWIFDDTVAVRQSFRFLVTDASGIVSVSPVLEIGNGYRHAIEGFIGVTSTRGITKVAIENLDESDLTPSAASIFEVDHVQLGNPSTRTGCIEVRLSDYNLFLLEDYSGGHAVEGKVAAGGNISMTDFAVGSGLPANDTANTLVAGGSLTLSRGSVWGDAHFGDSCTTDSSVLFPRGTASQGSPINFTTRGTELRNLSRNLADLTSNGSTTIEPWGGVMLRGTDPVVNVFQVSASDLSNAVLLSIDAPAGSQAVLNISGAAATLRGGHSFSGGIDQRGVLFNFVDATAISASDYGLWGTMLAPQAHVSFNNGSFDGGIYARSMTGNADGRLNPLQNRDICP